MKILIADKASPDMIAEMERMGGEVTYKPDLKAEDLPGAIGEAGILVVRSTKVREDTVNAGEHLRLIVRAGAGVNTIDLEAASNRGIFVANCPGMNTDAVAELAIGLLIAADRRIPDATAALRAGQWRKGEFGKARGLRGRNLGIVGLGQIGIATAKRAQALGMHVLAWSRSLTEERAEELGLERAEDPLDLARRCDAVSVHLAATPETKHLLGKSFFDAMPAGGILVNTARGEVVETQALMAAIDDRGLRVALDVYEDEPSGGKADFPHKTLAERVVCTPHIGASTDQAAQAIAAETVRIVKSFIRSGHPLNVVNLKPPTEDKTQLLIRHNNRLGVLARILTALRDQGTNIEEMQDSLFQTGTAACCCMALDSPPSQETLQQIQDDDDVFAAEIQV